MMSKIIKDNKHIKPGLPPFSSDKIVDPFYSLDTCVQNPNHSHYETYFKRHFVKLNLNKEII